MAEGRRIDDPLIFEHTTHRQGQKLLQERQKPLMHHVETKSTFIQWQSWQMMCHSGPTDRRGHTNTPIPRSITHPGKGCGYFTMLRLMATMQ